jgi:flavin reductase (DIM6/NTAB) family NADH-FMN oxidoreductase RutF
MRRLLRLLYSGRSLRHRAVALREGAQRPVRAVLVGPGGERDVTGCVVPVSLNPFLLGIHAPPGEAAAAPAGLRVTLRMEEVVSGKLLGRLLLRAEHSLSGALGDTQLFRPLASRVDCEAAVARWWKYLLAWRQVRAQAGVPHAFAMSFADLRALNVFYMMPRPVHLVSVVHQERSNLFPMDLVGPVGQDTFVLALRATSPSIELMRASGRIVFSGAPAALKEVVFRLGAHHKARSIDWDGLPIAVRPSPHFGIPVPQAALRVRELEVAASHDIGSHVFFVTTVAADTRLADEPQLAHVSDMYARWAAAAGRPFDDA